MGCPFTSLSIFTFSTNISSPFLNGKSLPWLKNPLAADPVSGNGALNSNVTNPLFVMAPLTTTPLELLIGTILISLFKPVSLANISTLPTADPFNFDWATTTEFPTTTKLGGVVYSTPPVETPIDFKVNTFFRSKIKLLSAFGCKSLLGENSIPCTIVCVPSIFPISSVSIVNIALLPVVVPIEVKIGSEETSKP